MDRVAGEEYAAFAVVVREEQVLLPLAHVEHLVFHGDADGPLELPRHVLVLADDRVERPVPSRILHDQERRRIVGDMVMAPFAGTVGDRDALVEIFAAVQRLAQLQEVALAAQTDAELVTYPARAAVAADEIGGAQARDRTGAVADPRRHAGRVLLKRQELAAVAHRHARQGLRHGLEQGLQGVLGNELIRLERHRAVGAGVDLALGFGHRRIRQAQQRRLVHRQDHVDIHRRVAVQPGRADLAGETHAPEDFHRAGVAALHLGEELRRFLALDQRAAHAFLAEVDGERQSDRPGADDQDLGIRSHAVIIYAVNRAALILEQAARKIGVAAAWAGIPLMVVFACLEPVLRWAGLGGDLPFGEASTAAFFALTMTSFGYAYAAGAHVRLEVLSRRFSPRARAAIELTGTVLILLPLCAVVLMDGTESAWRSFQQAERWADTGLTLQWVLRAWVPAGFLLLMLASIASALRAIVTLAAK